MKRKRGSDGDLAQDEDFVPNEEEELEEMEDEDATEDVDFGVRTAGRSQTSSSRTFVSRRDDVWEREQQQQQLTVVLPAGFWLFEIFQRTLLQHHEACVGSHPHHQEVVSSLIFTRAFCEHE